MTETVFALVAQYGSVALVVVTFLSCLALPVPASLMMLTGGAFAASGDLSLVTVTLAAYGGAIAGDQASYQLGHSCARWLERWSEARRGRAMLLARARASVDRWGGMGVFLSRWFVSPLGPYVNFAGGAGRMPRGRFTLWSVAGEMVWVVLYVGLGDLFAGSLTAVAEFAADLSGLVAGAVVAVGLGFWLRMMHQRHARLRS